mgnify:CR=1 FL=1
MAQSLKLRASLIASLAILLTGCASSNNPAPVNVALPVPARIAAEASRAPVAIPAGKTLDNKQTAALLVDMRKSELRFKRAAKQAVAHSRAAATKGK